LGKEPSDVEYEHVSKVKQIITKNLSPYSTATLMDPTFGYPYSINYLPKEVGMLIAYEETGSIPSGENGKERASHQVAVWSVEKAVKAGVDAIKLLVYYHPDASEKVCVHQQDFVKFVGNQCERYDRPFLLELVSYAIEEESNKTPEFAKKKPELVIRSAQEFSKPEYKVDVLKLEFPGELKYTKEFEDSSFYAGSTVYDLNEIKGYCQKLNDIAQLPWVILSAGVDIEEFIEDVRYAVEAGASGFLCGRAIWKDCVQYYPDIEKMEEFIQDQCVQNFKNSNEVAENAIPWFEHKKFGSWNNIQVAKLSPTWCEDY
jgi:tagatose 1,6-diphosphate aldolase